MQQGFSLVELAMVLFIISLLLGGLLVPLATQLEARQRNDARLQLERIKEALIGFAIVNGRLPCYTSEADPADDYYGIEDSADPDKTCNPTGRTSDGILPWKSLGMEHGRDPWGVERSTAADSWLGYWRYRVDSNFTASISLATGFSEQLDLIDSDGNSLNASSEYPVAIIYSTGANQAQDGENADYEATLGDDPIYQGGPVSGDFDDITAWLTRPLLFNRMVTAGVLP